MSRRPPVLTTWRSVVVDGATVRLMEATPEQGAQQAEPLLFLHGWGLTPRAYEAGIAGLTSAGVRVLAPALPGFGGSDGPPLSRVTLDFYAHRIGRLLDVLDLEHPVFVAGHSFGGGVALQLATDRPELVRSLTLVNSVGGAPGRRSGLVDASWLRWAAGTVTELSPRHVLRSSPRLLRDFVPNVLRRPLTSALAARVAVTVSLADEAEDLLARGLPVLFVWGDADRLITPGELSDISGDLPPEVVRGRHGWLLTDPEEFTTLMRNALVVHAMLERRHRGQSLVLPHGWSLSDLIPPERRRRARTSQRRNAELGA